MVTARGRRFPTVKTAAQQKTTGFVDLKQNRRAVRSRQTATKKTRRAILRRQGTSRTLLKPQRTPYTKNSYFE